MRKMRRYVPLALLALAAVGIGVPAALSQQPPGTELVIKTAPQAVVVDLKSPGFSAGDMILMRGVADEATTGEKVGMLTIRCQRIRAAANNMWARILCDGELHTPDGKLTFAGSRMQGEKFMNGRFAITGGTGDYATAGGSILTEDDDARNKWTFNIIDLGAAAPAP